MNGLGITGGLLKPSLTTTFSGLDHPDAVDGHAIVSVPPNVSLVASKRAPSGPEFDSMVETDRVVPGDSIASSILTVEPAVMEGERSAASHTTIPPTTATSNRYDRTNVRLPTICIGPYVLKETT